MKILVTGGNTGIGLAVCKQLALDYNAHVYLAARNPLKGQNAASSIQSLLSRHPSTGSVTYIPMDTSSDESVLRAYELVKEELHLAEDGDTKLYGLVNNAGIGLNTGTSPADILNTNLFGPKRVCDAFVGLLDEQRGRIVNLGSGSGPMYVRGCNAEDQKMLSNPDTLTLGEIEEYAKRNINGPVDPYGLSKACLACYTGYFARQYPNILSSCVSPGFIDTQMTSGYGASKTPEQGTVSIKHCLLEPLKGNGFYYGSDAIRSPYHFLRNPGEPEYDGKYPF